jgi:hypothetical protein
MTYNYEILDHAMIKDLIIAVFHFARSLLKHVGHQYFSMN